MHVNMHKHKYMYVLYIGACRYVYNYVYVGTSHSLIIHLCLISLYGDRPCQALPKSFVRVGGWGGLIGKDS